MRTIIIVSFCILLGVAVFNVDSKAAVDSGVSLMCDTASFQINCAEKTGTLNHFWNSTGFTPAAWMLKPDMRQNCIYFGSVPHDGIRYVRVHNFLELLKINGVETDSPEYDFSSLDEALDLLVHNGLVPIFEIMGFPTGTREFFKDFGDDKQLWAWRKLVNATALRYLGRYGKSVVYDWLFETWNEPDANKFWKENLENWPKYYDACSAGLMDADPNLKFGGPGTCGGFSKPFKVALDHFQNGKDYFTGNPSRKPDFFSVHIKGPGAVEGCIDEMLEGEKKGEIRQIKYIREHAPRIADVPFVNDEWDIIVGWNKNTPDWHAWPYYASWVCASVYQHIVRVIDGLGANYFIMSNDNGFLGPWGFRTQLARFTNNELLAQERFDLIKKPVHNVMTLLSLLGDTRVASKSHNEGTVYVQATRRGESQVAILVFNHHDAVTESEKVSRVKLDIEGLPFGKAMLAHYRIDSKHGSPWHVWKEMGSPEVPDTKQIAALRAIQELAAYEKPRTVEAKGGKLSVEFDLPLPGISLILLSSKPAKAPAKVQNLRVEKFTGVDGKPRLMAIWDDLHHRSLQTYEVLFSRTLSGPFKRVNEQDILCTAFIHPASRGYFKVRAVDYWGRIGEESEIAWK